jgi:hypothetical protein
VINDENQCEQCLIVLKCLLTELMSGSHLYRSMKTLCFQFSPTKKKQTMIGCENIELDSDIMGADRNYHEKIDCSHLVLLFLSILHIYRAFCQCLSFSFWLLHCLLGITTQPSCKYRFEKGRNSYPFGP